MDLQWLNVQSYTADTPPTSWLYNITHPMPGPGASSNYRATKRDSSLAWQYQQPVNLGSYDQLVDAVNACSLDAEQSIPDIQLNFLAGQGYQSAEVPGWNWVYNIIPARPIPYLPVASSAIERGWRGSKRDITQDPQFVIAIDMGIFQRLDDAMTACQNDYDAAGGP